MSIDLIRKQAKEKTVSELRTALNTVHSVSGADYTVLSDDGYRAINLTNSGGDRTITLPPVAENTGRMITINKLDDNNYVKVDHSAGDEVDVYGVTTFDTGTALTVLDKGVKSVTLLCDGTIWRVISGGAFIGSAGLNPNGDFTGGEVHWRKIGPIVHIRVENPSWNAGAFIRDSNVIVPGPLTPANRETAFASTADSGSGENTIFSITTDQRLRVRPASTGQAVPPYGLNWAGSYFVRG